MDEITLKDVCQYGQIDALSDAARDKMLKAPQTFQDFLNEALMEEYNPSLCRCAAGLKDNGFTKIEAIEVIRKTKGHREPVGNEIERAVDLIYGAASSEPVKKSPWSVFKTPIAEVLANIKHRSIESLSEEELVAKLGDTPEIDNVSDFLAEFFKGVDRPVYLGSRYQGMIAHTSSWMMVAENIIEEGYDQLIANPMRRTLTAEERTEKVNGKLKYASGGRCLEFASETLDVVTFECDKIPLELQLGVIRYLARHLPLVSVVFSANKSYHAYFSAKGVSNIHALRKQLVDLGGDGAVLNPAYLTRLGAVHRSNKGKGFQRVLWIDGDARHESVDPQKLSELLPEEVESEVVVSDGRIPDDVFPVPAGGIGNNTSAEIIFPAMGKMKRLFIRGSTVHEIVKGHGSEYLSPLSPERFCSLVESAGYRVARKEVRKDKDTGVIYTIWRSTTFPVSAAKILLETDASRKHLPPIRQIVNCPVMTTEGKILTRGYHDHSGGTYIGAGHNPEEVLFGTAVRALLGILGDFEFAAESDLSRAFASLISPALKMGGWIEDDFPLDLAEATESQSGKTFRQKLVCRIYNEVPSSITLSRGGVGSIDESISTALVKGRPFVTLANMRGKVDSTILEEALRGSGHVTCRTLGNSTEVDCKPFLWQFSTNGAELTRDLANRAIVTRIRKKPAGYEWKEYAEGNLETHIQAKQGFYMGCVFAVLSKWDSQGRPTTKESRHDFQGWCRALDGIVQMCGLKPLLDGHKEQQERTANPQLQWLRDIILAVKPEQYGEELYTYALTDIAEECGIDFPGNPFSRDEPHIRAGRILGKIFRDADGDIVEVDGFSFTRTEEPDYVNGASGRLTKKYTIKTI